MCAVEDDMELGALRRAIYKTFCRTLALILALCLFLSLRLGAAEPFSEDKPRIPTTQVGTRSTPSSEATLTLRVYNYARLDAASLAASEKVADAILQNVGIEAVWLDCPAAEAKSKTANPKTSSAEAVKYSDCDSEMGANDIVLRILPRNMAVKLRRSNDSLGSAQSCPETEPACELNVFYHRVDELAANGYRPDRILGHVIAHEVAHVLLGPRHSDDGILRAEWSSSDLKRISLGMHLGFAGDQSTQLRLAVLRRTVPPVDRASARANLLIH